MLCGYLHIRCLASISSCLINVSINECMEYCCMYYKLHVTVHVLSTMLSFLLQDLVTLHRRQEECPPYLLYWGGHPHPLPEPPRVLYYLPMHEGLYKVFWVGCEFHCLDEADCNGDILVYFSNSWQSLMVPQCSFSYLSDTKLSFLLLHDLFIYLLNFILLRCWMLFILHDNEILVLLIFFFLDDLLIPWVLPLSWSFTSTSHHWCVNSVTSLCAHQWCNCFD